MEMRRQKFFELVHRQVENDRYRVAIEFAYELAKVAHYKQPPRANGERYFSHVKAVAAIILQELNLSLYNENEITTLIIAALLHDLMEDTFVAKRRHLAFIFDQINPEITMIIETVTKVEGPNKFAKLLSCCHKLVKIIKGADRLHNQRTLCYCTPAKIRRKNAETRNKILPWLKFRSRDPNLLHLIDQIEKQTALNESGLNTTTPTRRASC